MDKVYDHKKYESEIYSLWEKSAAFKGSPTGKPYTILMPPPNANASLHAGHAMYTVDDVMARFKRMQEYSVEWIPGTDHAGFETQFVYEKELAKEGKSRLDFDRETLYKNIYDFVQKNSGAIFEQFKRLGFSADWERSVFTLDKNVLLQVFETFKKMEVEGLVYRDGYIVNYCTHCGTSLAELEVIHETKIEPLYYIKYGPFVLATVRPETKFGDTALAVHPKDKRYKKWVGQEVEVEGLLGKFKIKVIEDTYVDPKFGTGVVKITPAHDPNDFEVWKRHKNEIPGPKEVIDMTGRLTDIAGKYKGLKVREAREIVVKDLQEKRLIEKIDETYEHSIVECYKCKHTLEPLIVPNWFIKVEHLKKKVKSEVEKEKVKFYPKKFKRHMLNWLEIMHDWPISRQIVWGIRIPVWYKIDPKASNIWVWWLNKNNELQLGHVRQFLEKGIKIENIEKGLQKVLALTGENQPEYIVSVEKPRDGNMYLPETDTFDTWFSSGQWPIVTLKEEELKTRFPTNLMATLSDILKFWVSRMIMFSLYLKNEVPFKDVYLWSMVADSKGVKMSKSKGNVINPLDLVEKYGADALRMSLIYGIPAGSKVILADEKVRGMRNFANKIWNIARFVFLIQTPSEKQITSKHQDDKWILKELKDTTQKTTSSLERYELNDAAEEVYDFIWHKFADIYIEKSKERRNETQPILIFVLQESLKLLHPFMPFVTEAIWGEIKSLREKPDELLITSSWPKA